MAFDIVLPKENETAFVRQAEKLGYNGLIFLYLKITKSPSVKTPLILLAAAKDGTGLLMSNNAEKGRHLIEQSPTQIFYGFEEMQSKDYIHHRGSGLNQVLCKLLHTKKKQYAFSFASLLKADPKQRAEIIGRMQQNVRLCKKYKVPMFIASFATHPTGMRSPHDLTATFQALGVDCGLLKELSSSLQRPNRLKGTLH